MAKMIAGNSCKDLAYGLSQYLGLEYWDVKIKRFADEELRVQLTAHLYEEDAIIVQSTCKPANDHLMELLLLVDAAKRSGAHKVIALIPYFGYSRQDRPFYEWGPTSARLVATMLEAAGVDHLITLDLHSKQSEGFFKIGVQNIDSIPLFASTIDKSRDLVVVSPDVGGLIRARKLSESLDCGLAIINKSRKEHNTCQMDDIIGNVTRKHCIIVDDITDTGGTLCKASILLREHGAFSVQVVVTHPVLSGNATARLEQAPIEKIITTGSVPQNSLPAKFEIVNIIPLIASALVRVMPSPILQ
ncbi:Ribose-phosphate pyrophosphokinase [Alphaproteobacteria bacterium]